MTRTRYKIFETDYPYFMTCTINGWLPVFTRPEAAQIIVDLLGKHGAKTLLRQLRALKLRHKTESQFQVWQEGSKPKQIQNDEMMWQKIEYIHMNPVQRGYVDDPLHWRWSSASSYAGQDGLDRRGDGLAVIGGEAELPRRAFPSGAWERGSIPGRPRASQQ